MLKNFGHVIRILKNTGQIYINYACHEICLFVSFDDPQGHPRVTLRGSNL